MAFQCAHLVCQCQRVDGRYVGHAQSIKIVRALAVRFMAPMPCMSSPLISGPIRKTGHPLFLSRFYGRYALTGQSSYVDNASAARFSISLMEMRKAIAARFRTAETRLKHNGAGTTDYHFSLPA